MGADHRESVAEGDDDARLDAGQLGLQHQVRRDRRESPALAVVVPVNAKQVTALGRIGINPCE